MTTFWYNDISILFNKNSIFEIIPDSKNDYNKNLNILVRTSIYISLILFIICRSVNIF